MDYEDENDYCDNEQETETMTLTLEIIKEKDEEIKRLKQQLKDGGLIWNKTIFVFIILNMDIKTLKEKKENHTI